MERTGTFENLANLTKSLRKASRGKELASVDSKMFTVATGKGVQGDIAVYEICASTRLSTGVKVIFLFAFPFECWGKGN